MNIGNRRLAPKGQVTARWDKSQMIPEEVLAKLAPHRTPAFLRCRTRNKNRWSFKCFQAPISRRTPLLRLQLSSDGALRLLGQTCGAPDAKSFPIPPGRPAAACLRS
jgi:hypothetical protein